ncbi:MAG: PorT family protein [Prevotellaceae bacterium]|nr:PorT family protein [Prevotellaceae bacterium]
MKRILPLLLAALMAFTTASAQQQRVQNRPYIDQRRWHYGFLAGIHTQDYRLVNTGITTEAGQTWFADVPEYSPGFSVGVLGELYLTRLLALRIVPTLHFGDKRVVFREQTGGEQYVQNMKSAYLSIPVDLKFAAERVNNYRPYVMAGIAPTYDFSVKKHGALLVYPFDCYVELGVGCDFYLPYFKLIPELKFCFGLSNLLNTRRTDLTDLSLTQYTQAVSKITSRMIVLSFYFE